ncbi:MAG: GAF domain-containing protein [Sporichthyaceae bacterium]
MSADVPQSGPSAPRLEMDELLTQLIARAEDVLATQGRLRGLLEANAYITGYLPLPEVLERIVTAACRLSGARYGVIGVLNDDGGLGDLYQVGMDAATMAAIGRLPEGKGLLGALIADPHPIRLQRISDDPRSVGLPAGHPPMDAFLGVPIRVRDVVFGNLYLAEPTSGEFSADDEEIVTALAASAGIAVENARRYEQDRRLAVLEDRQRIAVELHDLVLQRLFAAGLSMQAIAAAVGGEPAQRLEQLITETDETITSIRSVIHSLGPDGPGALPTS